jgi:lipopolysaccharide export system protein LptC
MLKSRLIYIILLIFIAAGVTWEYGTLLAHTSKIYIVQADIIYPKERALSTKGSVSVKEVSEGEEEIQLFVKSYTSLTQYCH